MPLPTNGDELRMTKIKRAGLLTVKDVLSEIPMAEVTEVKTVAPAIILILERDAPARLEVAGANTTGEQLALQERLRRDELAMEITAAYFAHQGDNPLAYAREGRHAERLQHAHTLRTH